MKLDEALKNALNELRMQMLGLQVLFGFQFQGLFQDAFEDLGRTGRAVNATGLGLVLTALAIIVAAPSQHRLIEHGEATPRIYHTVGWCARASLLPISAALGCAVYVPLARAALSGSAGPALGVGAVVLALLTWYAFPLLAGDRRGKGEDPVKDSPTPLAAKIEQMLMESRVILPGAQALLGFQLVVMMARSFDKLPPAAQYLHITALMALCLTVILLIAPAAVHRIGFQGREDPRVHALGSALVTAGLVPLAIALACDLYVAVYRLFDATTPAIAVGGVSFVLLMSLWYALPLLLRRHQA